MKEVYARGADGVERQLALVRIEGKTAYVCPVSRYREAIAHPESQVEVGFPISDVRAVGPAADFPLT